MREEGNFAKAKKISIIVAIVAIVIIIGTIIYNALKNARLTVIITPLDAELTINGSRRDTGTYDMFPGKKTIKVSKDGLDAKEIEVNLESNKTTTVYVYLTKDGSFDYYKSHPDDYEVLKLIGGDDTKDYLQKQEKLIDIQKILPLERHEDNPEKGLVGDETVIDDMTYDERCGEVVCLSLVDNTGSDDAARKLLEENGYNFDDFKIIRM